MGEEILLQMTDISKSFPGVKALDHVSLTVRKGTVHALMGENGAGKSTSWKGARSALKAVRKRWKTAWPWCIRS